MAQVTEIATQREASIATIITKLDDNLEPQVDSLVNVTTATINTTLATMQTELTNYTQRSTNEGVARQEAINAGINEVQINLSEAQAGMLNQARFESANWLAENYLVAY